MQPQMTEKRVLNRVQWPRNLVIGDKGGEQSTDQGDQQTTNNRGTRGACGDVSVDTDFIVALDQRFFGTSYPSPYCNRKITMLYGGKTTTATIKDSCLGCAVGGLDLSPGLFSFFADLGEGTIYGTWSFLDGSDNRGDDMSTTK
ncbi:hypothetical protein DFH08DRAFT_63070 [Mycena albidolilacea]|uniref:Uncharacterized protein n=1 Tax=Mycena albidolilacea TaxID=1033008 RepID=A0AAD7AAA0_9AGAR|nr:hypothetical protein DFH08DRAFT_63070 [Mycena albidolilacea]